MDGTKWRGTFVPLSICTNSSFVLSLPNSGYRRPKTQLFIENKYFLYLTSQFRTSISPIILAYWPEPPVWRLCKYSNLYKSEWQVHKILFLQQIQLFCWLVLLVWFEQSFSKSHFRFTEFTFYSILSLQPLQEKNRYIHVFKFKKKIQDKDWD